MAPTSPTSLLLKRLSLFSTLKLCHHRLLYLAKPFGTSSPQQNPTTPPPDPKPSSLSSRLSFVFDQIDAMEKQRSQQDQTLQKIRAWRQSNQTQQNPDVEKQESARIDISSGSWEREVVERQNPEAEKEAKEEKMGVVELVHPWPEWIELMERLVQQNYFDHRRRDEDKMMVQQLGIDDVPAVVGGGGGGGEEGVAVEVLKDFKTVQTACVNFGKDRFDILRSLSRNDIQILIGYGCPSTDKKVVFSGKLLRKRVHLDEGDVCSSCSLRNSCEKAYLLTNKEDEARTVDIMRVLFVYGIDPLNGSVANKDLLKKKAVKTVVRKLLHEIVKLSAVPIDPNLPPPVIKKPPPKVKQPPPPPKKRVGRDDIEMKKGDWLCPKCDFMNFAKNTVCLQCDAKRPKRQLLPGEWECPECNFLNYRRNTTCFHCDCKRPPDEFIENKTEEKQNRLRTEKVTRRKDVSSAWNFDFDDDESDGADVAAFEYADSSLMDKDSPLSKRTPGGEFKELADDFDRRRGAQRFNGIENYDLGRSRQSSGFDDFDDEDGVDSYEIDMQKDGHIQKAASYNFSDVEGFSESEDNQGPSQNSNAYRRESSDLYNRRKKPGNRKAPFSDDDELGSDTDDEVSITPKWKSSHVASGHNNRSRAPSKRLSFGSDEEFGLDSDIDDDLNENFNGRKGKSRDRFKSRGNSFLASDSDNDGNFHSSTSRSRGNQGEPRRSKGRTNKREKGLDDYAFDRPSRGSRGNGRQFREDNKGWQRTSNRGNDSRNSKGPKQGGFRDRPYDYGRDNKDTDYGEFRNSRRVIER